MQADDTTLRNDHERIGRIRLIAAAICIAYNALAITSIDFLGIHRERWLLAQIPNGLLIAGPAYWGS